MNHDATHCADYKKSCPKSCYRAQLTEELKKIYYPLPVSWAHFKGTKECLKQKGGKKMNWQTKLKIKHKLQIFIEKVTGTGCENCRHNDGFICHSPKHDKCTKSIFPVGFAKRKRGKGNG